MSHHLKNINQNHDVPAVKSPIYIIGAGGIVRDAHLPAYRLCNFDVNGIFDIKNENALKTQEQFPLIKKVYDSLELLIEEAEKSNGIFDLAVPASQAFDVIKKLPDSSSILIQKPLGETLDEALKIHRLCKNKKLKAAINFQLPFAPYMLAAKSMIDQGLLGKIYDVEFSVCVYTPWHLWDFLFSLPRVEILYHSIHYIDLIRNVLGTPKKVYASTLKHPDMNELASTRSTIIMDYDEFTQARILTNHGHKFGLKNQESYCKIEGTKGAIKIRIGLSLDYPRGKPPLFEYYLESAEKNPKKEWIELPLRGGWFPHAFTGPMSMLQIHANNKEFNLPNSIDSGLETMKIVEAAYQSSDSGGHDPKNL